MALAQYLSKPRIEGPLCLDPADIPFLRARLLKAETRLESLEAQISEVLDERALLRNVLSPIRRVPSEILSNIFEHTCTPGTSITDEFDFDVVRSTSVISSVCVAWRKTAHATPQLWSYLRVDLRKQPYLLRGDVSWVKEWLSRGRSLPLDLDLRFQWYHTLDKEDLAQGAAQMLESILDFRHRIRSCSIMGDLKLCLPLFCLPRSSLSELKEINLIHFSTEGLFQDVRVFPARIEVFLGAPKLRRVRISEPMHESVLQLLALPADQLIFLDLSPTSESVRFDSPPRIIDVLGQCKDLVNLRITLPIGSFGRFDTSLPIHLSALKSLTISCHSSSNSMNLLACITTPHLEDLTLRWDGQDMHDLATDVVAFQKRSAATLKSLKLSSFGYNHDDQLSRVFDENLQMILDVFPTVRSFNIFEPAFDLNPLMLAMTCFEGRRPLLPRLTNFQVVSGFGCVRQHARNLPFMLLSRWWPGKLSECDGLLRLQTVYLAGLWLKGEEASLLKLSKLDVDYRSCDVSSEDPAESTTEVPFDLNIDRVLYTLNF